VNHLRVFGYRAFVKQLGHVDKLVDRSRAEVLIGYAEGAKAYRIFDPVTWQVCSSRDVVFDEAIREWQWQQGWHHRAFQAHRHDHLLLMLVRRPCHP
jgi:hypothetical protein